MPEVDVSQTAVSAEDAPPSKSAIKKLFKLQQKFVRDLVNGPDGYLTRLGLSDSVVEEIRSARDLSKSALVRQVRFISRLMADEDLETARRKLEALQQPDAAANDKFHQLEAWRESLLDGDEQFQNQLVDEYAADRQQLRTLVRNARKERESGSQVRHYRLLFRYLRSLTDSQGPSRR